MPVEEDDEEYRAFFWIKQHQPLLPRIDAVSPPETIRASPTLSTTQQQKQNFPQWPAPLQQP
jgi:hypothetical protein